MRTIFFFGFVVHQRLADGTPPGYYATGSGNGTDADTGTGTGIWTGTTITDYDDDSYNFGWFVEFYNKTYSSAADKEEARTNYNLNKQEIDNHNVLYESGYFSYEMGINEFADIDLEALLARNGRKPRIDPNATSSTNTNIVTSRRKRATLPTFFSWKDKGKVTSVKNQERCGGCYAFSSAAAIESRMLIKGGTGYNLSPQQTIDCSGSFGNAGCNGGLETNSFRYIKSVGGLDPWDTYPYKGHKQTCAAKKPEFKGAISGFKSYNNVSPYQLKTMLINQGPICVGMDASLRSFNYYKGGIYSDRACKKSYYSLDHAVLLVGYGVQNGREYWLIKNSWGTTWGNNGFFKIAIANNVCGIRTDVSYPILA